MTEAEATQKWCPFVRLAANLWQPDGNRKFETGFNRIADAGDEALQDMNCLGSGCMAWLRENEAHADVNRGRCGLVNPSLG